MIFKDTRVLILEGYARQSLPLIKAFHDLGCEVSVLCSSRLDVAYVSRYTDRRVLGICDRDREEETTEQIRTLLKTGKYDIVVPTVDFSARVLSRNKEEFSAYAKVASNDWNVYEIAGDKEKTMQICMENDIPCPKTVIGVNSIEDIENSDLNYPIAMKPRVGYGAIGFKTIRSGSELKEVLSQLKEPLEYYQFQEYIPQTELQYECAMFIDDNNDVKTGLVFSKNRWFPVTGGSSTLNITVDRPDIVESCSRLLKFINWRGAADIDLIQDPRDGIAKIMEINPRVSGSVKIAFAAGADQARQMLEMAYGQPVTDYTSYITGKRLRCSQTDMLWFINSPDRFRSDPSWFSMKNTADHTFSLKDPLPWFAFSLQGLTKLRKELAKRGVGRKKTGKK